MPSFAEDKKTAGEDTVNEFYFRQMKNELVKATGRGTLAEEKQLKMNFQRFFKAIEKINNAMLERGDRLAHPREKGSAEKDCHSEKRTGGQRRAVHVPPLSADFAPQERGTRKVAQKREPRTSEIGETESRTGQGKG